MPIDFNCIHCGEPLVEPNNRAGQRSRCTNCQASVIVPKGTQADAAQEAVTLESAETDDWSRFGRGCRWVYRGLWLELFGAALLFAILEVILLQVVTREKLDWFDKSVPFFLVPMLGLQAFGSALVLYGRFNMIRLPRCTGASALLIGTFALTAIRMACLVAAFILACVAQARLNSQEEIEVETIQGVACMSLASVAGVLADLTVIPALAIVGGSLKSLALRRKIGVASALLQAVAVAYVGLLALVLFSGMATDVRAQRDAEARRRAEVRRNPRVNPAVQEGNRLEAANRTLAVPPLWLTIAAGYTWIHCSMYAASRRAAVAAQIEFVKQNS